MIRDDAVEVTLPGGLWLDGENHRGAEICPLSGRDEAFVHERTGALPPAHLTTELLTRNLTRLGPFDAVTREHVAALTIGDREVLLLHLRRLTLGDRLDCVLDCPSPECGQKIELDMRVSNFLLDPYDNYRQLWETPIGDDNETCTVRFRLPNGADQEAAVDLARRDTDAAQNFILDRCVESIRNTDGKMLEKRPAAVDRDLPGIMANLDPQAEIQLDLTCPECSREFKTVLDTAAYFFAELADRADTLLMDVHELAFHYHWSEAEILGMTTRKRRRYLTLLSDALAVRSGR